MCNDLMSNKSNLTSNNLKSNNLKSNNLKSNNLTELKSVKNSKKLHKGKVIKTKVSQIDTSLVKCKRSGIILYTMYQNTIYFGLGLDSRTHELTDFAGTVCYNNGENVLEGGLREFDEETLSIFNKLEVSDIESCTTLYDSGNMIIFVRIGLEPVNISKQFLHYYKKEFNRITEYNNNRNPNSKKKYLPEVCSITWLTLKQFIKCVHSKEYKHLMFSRPRNLLMRAGNFYNLL